MMLGSRFWEDPSILGINKRAAHSPLRSHVSQASALRSLQPGGQASYAGGIKMLSGCDWDFKWVAAGRMPCC